MSDSHNKKQQQQQHAIDSSLPVEVVRSEFSDDVLRTIVSVILSAIDKYVMIPTQIIAGSAASDREEIKVLLEREVERTSLIPMSKFIKTQLDEQVGAAFHVVYGRSFGLHVSHERCNFAHIRVSDADVVVWKHGE